MSRKPVEVKKNWEDEYIRYVSHTTNASHFPQNKLFLRLRDEHNALKQVFNEREDSNKRCVSSFECAHILF